MTDHIEDIRNTWGDEGATIAERVVQDVVDLNGPGLDLRSMLVGSWWARGEFNRSALTVELLDALELAVLDARTELEMTGKTKIGKATIMRMAAGWDEMEGPK